MIGDEVRIMSIRSSDISPPTPVTFVETVHRSW